MSDGEVEFDVNVPQGRFLSMQKRFRAFIAGFGSGKTFLGCTALCLAADAYPGIPQGYFAPTYPQIRDIFYPTMEEVAEKLGMTVKIKESKHEVRLYRNGALVSTIICRSMEHPGRIVGFKIGRGLIDEMDIMALAKARLAWRKIIARLRWKGPKGFQPQIDVTTTPEGFMFMWEMWVKAVRDKPELAELYGMVQASTYDNRENLPEGYIESLYDTYPKELIDAYLDGKFVNMASGTVYAHYDRELNRTDATIQEGEDVHIGMDFNVNKMAGIAHVIRADRPAAIGELVNIRDTPSMIEAIKAKYWVYDPARSDWVRTRQIYVYPDASGRNTSSKNASLSDIALLEAAGFRVHAPAANPPIKDRVLAMNMLFCDNKGVRHYMVNDTLAPTYAENLEQQVYGTSGEPDKTAGKDHTNDGGGYFIHSRWPVIKPTAAFNLNMARSGRR